MNGEQFMKVCKEFMGKEAEIMNFKGGEYAPGKDRLANFKEIAEFVGFVQPSQVAWFYLMKHVQSVNNVMTGSGQVKWYWEFNGKEGLKQRLVDIRNYVLLLAACIEEETALESGPTEES